MPTVDLDLSTTKSGDMSYDASGMVNIPLSESWALRLVGFSAKDGGFIDIVEGHTPRFGLLTNDDAVQEDFQRRQVHRRQDCGPLVHQR